MVRRGKDGARRRQGEGKRAWLLYLLKSGGGSLFQINPPPNELVRRWKWRTRQKCVLYSSQWDKIFLSGQKQFVQKSFWTEVENSLDRQICYRNSITCLFKEQQDNSIMMVQNLSRIMTLGLFCILRPKEHCWSSQKSPSWVKTEYRNQRRPIFFYRNSEFWDLRPFRHLISMMSRQKDKWKRQKIQKVEVTKRQKDKKENITKRKHDKKTTWQKDKKTNDKKARRQKDKIR